MDRAVAQMANPATPLEDLFVKLSSSYTYSDYNIAKRQAAQQQQQQPFQPQSHNARMRAIARSPPKSTTLAALSPSHRRNASSGGPKRSISYGLTLAPTSSSRSIPLAFSRSNDEENSAAGATPVAPSRPTSPFKDDQGDVKMSGRVSPIRAPNLPAHLAEAIETPLIPLRPSAMAMNNTRSVSMPSSPVTERAPVVSPSKSSPPVKTSTTHPLHVSPLIPTELLSSLYTAFFFSPSLSKPTWPWVITHASPPVNLNSLLHPPHLVECKTPKLGNLLLSSCPGKKVRLTGPLPAGGRTGICRDLRTDLERYSTDFGVTTIINCLDDEELALLGAPWREYEVICKELGIAVIRFPMTEGHPPDCVEQMDEVLERVVVKQTLRGENVLVHCRGGVGRAGLVGVCWMLKMGLFGDLPQDEVEAMELVATCVQIIRKRRSTKSIETAIQVQFILHYILHLASQATLTTARDLASS